MAGQANVRSSACLRSQCSLIFMKQALLAADHLDILKDIDSTWTTEAFFQFLKTRIGGKSVSKIIGTVEDLEKSLVHCLMYKENLHQLFTFWNKRLEKLIHLQKQGDSESFDQVFWCWFVYISDKVQAKMT